MKMICVIPVGQDREANLACVLQSLANQEPVKPDGIVLIYDGFGIEDPLGIDMQGIPVKVVECSIKHEPGREQPRNIGVRYVRKYFPDATHVWFVDSDVVVVPNACASILDAYAVGIQERVMVCPYDWMPPGVRPEDNAAFFSMAASFEHVPAFADMRWPMFHNSPVERTYRSDLSAGTACFSGNLVWPIDQFERVGGFWSEIHHGRCEDGELGLRAVAMDVPISLCSDARGFHLWHPVNVELTLERNARDVPMLNARHPWMEGSDLFIVDEDGKRFNVRCECGKEMNTAEWWQHRSQEHGGDMELPAKGLAA